MASSVSDEQWRSPQLNDALANPFPAIWMETTSSDSDFPRIQPYDRDGKTRAAIRSRSLLSGNAMWLEAGGWVIGGLEFSDGKFCFSIGIRHPERVPLLSSRHYPRPTPRAPFNRGLEQRIVPRNTTVVVLHLPSSRTCRRYDGNRRVAHLATNYPVARLAIDGWTDTYRLSRRSAVVWTLAGPE